MDHVGRDDVKDGSRLFQNLLFQFGRNEMGLQMQASLERAMTTMRVG
jgi:hypothetical protein